MFQTVLQAATADGESMSKRIQADKDPSASWSEDISSCIQQASLQCSESHDFWEALTASSYDMAAISAFFELDTFNSNTETFQCFLERFFVRSFKDLLQQSVEEVEETLKGFPLAACGDRWTTAACQRVSRSFGLPRSGQAVHSLYHGRMNFYSRGPKDNAKVRVIPSDSAWNLTSHRGGCWLIGHSSVGKDQALAILQHIDKHLKQTHPGLAVHNTLQVGRLTYAGLLDSLENGANEDRSVHFLTWLNSEIRQCLGKRDCDIQECDFCQLAEASIMGKRTKNELKKFSPSFWFALGAHPASLHDFLGTTENGRLRGFSVFINRDEVLEIPFEEKMAQHSSSLSLLKEVAESLLTLQHVNNALPETQHTPSALVVFVALHEAARKVAQTIPVGDNTVASRLWPAMVKFVGKAHTALTFTNLCLRLSLWIRSSVARFACAYSSCSLLIGHVCHCLFDCVTAQTRTILHWTDMGLWTFMDFAPNSR